MNKEHAFKKIKDFVEAGAVKSPVEHELEREAMGYRFCVRGRERGYGYVVVFNRAGNIIACNNPQTAEFDEASVLMALATIDTEFDTAITDGDSLKLADLKDDRQLNEIIVEERSRSFHVTFPYKHTYWRGFKQAGMTFKTAQNIGGSDDGVYWTIPMDKLQSAMDVIHHAYTEHPDVGRPNYGVRVVFEPENFYELMRASA